MNGWIWFNSDYGWLAFLVLTGLGGAAAVATGRSLATSWSPQWLILPAIVALAAGVHFLHFALFQEDLSSLYYYLVTFVILLIASWTGYRAKRSRQMATQYSWAFVSSGLGWKAR